MVYPRTFYYLSFFLLFTLIAFYPTYLTRWSAAHWTQHLHGLTGTLWLIILIAQVWTIKAKHFKCHALMGKSTLIVAPLFLVAGFLSIHNFSNSPSLLAQRLALSTSLGEILVLILFAFLFFQGLKNRRTTDLHARYMLATVLLLLTPAISRFISYWVPGLTMTSIEHFSRNVLIAECVSLLVITFLIAIDIKEKKLSLPFPLVFFFIVIQMVVTNVVGYGSLWADIMQNFADLSVLQLALAALPLAILPSILGYQLGKS